MSQRINISYSIRMEALTIEAERLFSALLREIKTTAERSRVPSEILSVEALEEIGELKEIVKDLNYRLVDIEGIVKSYLQYVSEESSPSLAHVASVYDKLDELTKKLGMEKNEHEIPD